jgi:hypothetical protein
VEKSIYDLEMHEKTMIGDNGRREIVTVMRVPGGWIYTTDDYNAHNDQPMITSVFVPFNNEFQKNPDTF